tara:strand:+ start:239 stop:448 length:210 start_codon:yes stop_codon:yes gene_type:complete
MDNYENDEDRLKQHYEELKIRHRDLDNQIETSYTDVTKQDEIRRMKTMKLWLKDEMYRINAYLIQKGLE